MNTFMKNMFLNVDFFFFLNILFLFRGMGREGEREGEKHQCVVAFRTPVDFFLECILCYLVYTFFIPHSTFSFVSPFP